MTERARRWPGTLMIAAEGEVSTQTLTAAITSGSSTLPQLFTSPVAGPLFWTNWGAENYNFLAAASSATLEFSVTNQAFDIGLDAVSITPSGSVPSVPEPASWALFAVGLAALGALRLRRKETA